MNTKRIMAAILLIAMSSPAIAGWTVSGDVCQTTIPDSPFLIQVGQARIRVIEQLSDCNQRGAAARKPTTVSIQGKAHQAWFACTDKTDYQTVVLLPNSVDVNAIVNTLRTSSSPVSLSVFDQQVNIDATDFPQVCGGIVAEEAPPFDLKTAESEDERRRKAVLGYHMGSDGLWHRGPRTLNAQSEESKRVNAEFLNSEEERKRVEQKKMKAWADSQTVNSVENIGQIDPAAEARAKAVYDARYCAIKMHAAEPRCKP